MTHFLSFLLSAMSAITTAIYDTYSSLLHDSTKQYLCAVKIYACSRSSEMK